MPKKTYFTELLLVSVVAVLLALFSTWVVFTNREARTQIEEPTVTQSDMQVQDKKDEAVLQTEKSLVESFVTNYFNYSSENYKERLPNLQAIVSDSFYQALKSSFDDMFIEKGYESTLDSYTLYQSENDLESAFLTLTVSYEMNDSKQQGQHTAVISFTTIGDKKVISEFKFIQRSEY